MHSKIFETHAHYEDAKFDADREALIASLPEHEAEYAGDMEQGIANMYREAGEYAKALEKIFV